MKINIDNKNTEVRLAFTPAEYFLVHSKDDRYGGEDAENEKVWTLNPRIDRSEKGKDDDVGSPIVYLDRGEAEIFKTAGFSYLEM